MKNMINDSGVLVFAFGVELYKYVDFLYNTLSGINQWEMSGKCA